MFEPIEHGLTEQAEAHDADAPFRGRRNPDLAPGLLALLGDEGQEIAMQRQHGHGDIFDHALGDAGLQHPNQRNVRRQLREIELIDTSADREHEFEIAEGCADVFRRRPHRQITHLGGVADVRPEPERQFGRARRKQAGPFEAAGRVCLVEERHGAALIH